MKRFISAGALLASVVCLLLAPINIRAETTKDAYLGDGVVIHGGDASGIMMIGDENVTQMMKAGIGCIQNEKHYSTKDGLQAYAGDGYTTTDLIKMLDDLEFDSMEEGTVQTVIIYAGLNNLISGIGYDDYVDLVNKCKEVFNCNTVKLHLVCGVSADKVTTSGSYNTTNLAAFNTYIKSITNVEVINNFDSTWTDGYFQIVGDATNDGKHFNDTIAKKWHDNIVLNNSNQDTGSMSYITDTTSTLKVELSGVKQKLKATSENETQTETTLGVFNPKVTVLHSVNAALASSGNDVYYMPSLSEFPMDMKALVESGQYDNSGLYHGFAAAYDGQFDLEAQAQQYSTLDQSTSETVYYNTSPNTYKAGQSTRALEVLGYDFLLKDEGCNMYEQGNGLYARYKADKQGVDDSVTFETAIMDVYKALGQYCYSTQISFTPDSTLQPNTSPLQGEINLLLGSNNGSAWDNTEGSCWIFSTRTDPELYWDKAATEGIVSSIKETYGTFQPAQSDTNITLVEFCQLVSTMMQIYGEPVLTEEEQALLLRVYGKNLPIFLENPEDLEAVKYLVAKGVLDLSDKTDYIWSGNLKTEDMLDILMAVADKDSRSTFKDIDLAIDPTAEAAGYFPTTITGEVNPIDDIEYGEVNSNPSVYDYLIKAENITGNAADMKVNNSTDGIDWIGYVVNNNVKYSWYQVDSAIATVNFTNGYTDVSMTGTGGIYADGELISFKKAEEDGAWSDTSYLCDKEKAEEAALSVTPIKSGNTYLSDDYIPFAIVFNKDEHKDTLEKIVVRTAHGQKDLFSLTSGGNSEALNVDIGDNRSINIRPAMSADSTKMVLSVEGLKTKDEFSQYFEFKSNVGSKSYQVLQKSTNYALVPTDFLKDMGLINGCMELDGGNTLEIMSDTNNVYLCKDKGYVICGQGVYQTPVDTLLFQKNGNEYYVDYRAAIGWTSPYMIITDTASGSISVTFSKSMQVQNTVQIKNMTDDWNTGNTINVTMPGNVLPLNNNYPLANYFVYYTNEYASSNGATGDYLFVFKTAGAPVNGNQLQIDDTVSRNLLKTITGMNTDGMNGFYVMAYPLDRVQSEGGGNTNPPGVYFEQKTGYVYKPEAVHAGDGNIYNRYYYNSLDPTYQQPIGRVPVHDWGDTLALPIVKAGSAYYNINLDTFSLNNTQFEYGSIPTVMVNNVTTNAASKSMSMWICGHTTMRADQQYSNIMDVAINPAPTGVVANLLGLPAKNWETADDDNCIVFYGTLPGKVVTTDDVSTLNIVGFSYATSTDNADAKFTVLRETPMDTILGYNTTSIQALDETQNLDGSDYNPEVGEGYSREQFDWKNFKFKNAVSHADDWITIATYAILEFIPRLVILVCIALIALSLITNVKIWVRFCDRFFDIYKFLTLGRKDVHTIDTMTMTWSSVLGIGIFWLFLDGSVLRLFGWVARGIVGITMR